MRDSALKQPSQAGVEMPKSRKRKKKSTPSAGSGLRQMAVDATREQARGVREKFGRDPGPGDPLIFDPTADTPVPYPADKMQGAEKPCAGPAPQGVERCQ